MFKKHELLRLVKTDSGIAVDNAQKQLSRGVYICRSAECVALARKKKALQRQFKQNVGDAVYDKLLESIKD